MRFADGIHTLESLGVARHIEVGPDSTLTALTRMLTDASVTPTLRAQRPEAEALAGLLAHAHMSGLNPDWHALVRDVGPVELPTYAFQRERYWLAPRAVESENGLGHPLLTTAVPVAGTEQWLFSGRLSLSTHPWVADHVLLDTVVVPGTTFLEMSLEAGSRLGAERLDELTHQHPLVLDAQDVVRVQLVVDAPDDAGRRTLNIYSRPEAAAEDAPWTRHATGALVPDEADADAPLAALAAEAWPPANAEQLDIDDVYSDLMSVGYDYGPSFTGIRAAWRRGDELFVEAALDGEHATEAARFGVHPALFDAFVHGGAVIAPDTGGAGRMLFSWGGVRRYATGAASARVRVTNAADAAWTIAAVDEAGQPIVSVASLAHRGVEAEQLGARRGHDALFALEWRALDAPAPAADTERIVEIGATGRGRRPPAPWTRWPTTRRWCSPGRATPKPRSRCCSVGWPRSGPRARGWRSSPAGRSRSATPSCPIRPSRPSGASCAAR